jgi:hypothetical protein
LLPLRSILLFLKFGFRVEFFDFSVLAKVVYCSPGLQQPCTSNFLLLSGALFISYVKPIEKYLASEPQTGTKCQLHSQSKITTPRRENRKVNIILKANTDSVCVGTSDLRITPKNIRKNLLMCIRTLYSNLLSRTKRSRIQYVLSKVCPTNQQKCVRKSY